MAQTSDRISSMAARYANTQPYDLLMLTNTPEKREELARDIRSMSASLRRQDEHKGLRGLIRKVLG
jgi:hypothetical protein